MPDRDARARAVAKKLVHHCDHLLIEPILGACADCITTALVAFGDAEIARLVDNGGEAP